MKRSRSRRSFGLLLSIALIVGILVTPASASTRDTLQTTEDYFTFESGIIKVDWTKVLYHESSGNVISAKQSVKYRPTIYVPLNSKLTLVQEAVNQGYQIAIGQDDIATEVGLTSYICSSEQKMQVFLYDPAEMNSDGSFVPVEEIGVIGVAGGKAADLLTPFSDISYFNEPYHIRGPYNAMYWLVVPEELREDIDWAYSRGLLVGESETNFSPFGSITKPQAMTALWTYAGKPEPKNLNKNPFTDITESDPYYKAAIWAYENGFFKQYLASSSLFEPNKTMNEPAIINILETMFNCKLEGIRDGEFYFKQLYGGCTRVNFVHYLHFAHKYVTSDTSITPTTPDSPVTSTEPDVSTGFTDVKSDDYFFKAVQWAVEQKITSGTSKTTFSPNATCSKAQILAFLWRANGSPDPTATNPFTDVKTTDYFYKAALWAAEKGLVSGSTFGANTDCTRAMTMEYMWKAAGSPAASYNGKFNDVPASADYAQAVAWAVENKITSGTGGSNFSPAATCTRGQIVTFLHRAMGK
jgi:hypothetical protein